ncbi:hypothetical protein [Nostocoides vanveenii]|uniref:Uncharacterized protein n=1 Tax=Nostocoides vanveenii TaxID=330835 RepID=A0ABN2KQW9_9MICO
MTPGTGAPIETLQQLARRMLHTINDTSIAAMDASFYAHYFEELRLIVEAFLDDTQGAPAVPGHQIWIVWDCADPVACFLTRHEAAEAQADLRHQILCEYGPDPELMQSVTVSTAILEPTRCATAGMGL